MLAMKPSLCKTIAPHFNFFVLLLDFYLALHTEFTFTRPVTRHNNRPCPNTSVYITFERTHEADFDCVRLFFLAIFLYVCENFSTAERDYNYVKPITRLED